MNYRHLPALGRDVSRLVLGTLFLSTDHLDTGRPLLEEWVAAGGNAIDAAARYGFAHRYGFGDSERALGCWLRERPDLRGELTVVSKGGHPNAHRSRLTVEDIVCDLRDTMARLDGAVDLYLLHRDDPDVPVGRLLEALEEHRLAGRITAYGASNWTPERLDAAASYARAHGLEGFSCSSPHLSLARQNEPQWAGTVSASPALVRQWYERTQMPVWAWSAQARGFFTGRFAPGVTDDADVVRVYYSDENWERLSRARQLAARWGVTANDVALAWVLHQPFPTYAVIGPRTVEELHSSLRALEVELTPAEMAWLDLAADDPS